jgi:hypothetical protein
VPSIESFHQGLLANPYPTRFALQTGRTLYKIEQWGDLCESMPPCQNELSMTTRFLWALSVYAVLALMAAFTLDGNLRLAVWILLAGLTVKTIIAYKAGW